jgi:DNA primase
VNHVDRTELLRRIDLAGLLEVLAPAGERRQRGRWRCLHPDHEDRHPSVSMTVVDGIGRWRCWSCGRGGTAIDALLAARNLTVGEAIRQLAGGALAHPLPREEREDGPVPLHLSVESYAGACQRVLWTRAGRPVLDWLTERRGLSVVVLRVNRMGADPGPRLLARRRGLPRAGVAAVLPVFDPTGRLSYLQARYLEPGDGPKYGNPSRRLGTNPRLAWTRTPTLRNPDLLLVCEGIIDALTAATAGLPAVAVLGAAYPSIKVADTIACQAGDRQLVIAFDGDDPGRVAADRLHRLLTTRGVSARVWDLPEGADLNTLAQTSAGWGDRLAELRTVPA